MSFSDETLIAYAAGELDGATRRAVDEAMRRDANIARRLTRLRAAREDRLHATRDDIFADEPAAASPMRPRQTKVVQLAAVRAQRVATQQAARKAVKPRLGWREWGALTTVLVLGVVAGKFGLAQWQPAWLSDPVKAPTTVVSRNGMLVAQGKLDVVLSQHMGGAAPSESDVRVGLSFLSNEGGYCRSFTLVGLSQDLVGIACRVNAEWRIPVLVQNARPSPRMAGTQMPTAVLEAIDQRIVGGMLDTRAELEALRRNWQR
jgi:hypothetical protein